LDNKLAIKTIRDLSTEGSEINSVLKGLLTGLKAMNKPDIDRDSSWLATLEDHIRYAKEIKDGFEVYMATVLAIAKMGWDSLEETVKHPHSNFMQWALSLCPDWEAVTIYNYVSVAEQWILNIDNKPLPDKVEILVRTNTGLPIVEHGELVKERVEFDPFKINISKLLTAKGTYRRDSMTPELWEKLTDPHFSRNDLSNAINKDKIINGNTTQYVLEGEYIVVLDGINEFIIGSLNLEDYENDDLIKNSIDRIIKFLGIERDEDAIRRLGKNNNYANKGRSNMED